MEPYIENSADATDEKQQKEQKSFKEQYCGLLYYLLQ